MIPDRKAVPVEFVFVADPSVEILVYLPLPETFNLWSTVFDPFEMTVERKFELRTVEGKEKYVEVA